MNIKYHKSFFLYLNKYKFFFSYYINPVYVHLETGAKTARGKEYQWPFSRADLLHFFNHLNQTLWESLEV